MIFSCSTQFARVSETKQDKSRKFYAKLLKENDHATKCNLVCDNSQIWVKDLSRNTFALQKDKSKGGVGE